MYQNQAADGKSQHFHIFSLNMVSVKVEKERYITKLNLFWKQEENWNFLHHKS